MALIPIPKPQFPSVPELPGVPLLQRNASRRALSQELQAFMDNSLWRMPPAQQQWGIFTLDGKLLIQADTVLDIGFKLDHKIASYPVQSNAFNSYNKVAEPFQATVRLMKGGQLNAGDVSNSQNGMADNQGSRERGDFLEAIDQAAKSLQLYQVVTPERSYLDCNITGYSFKREQSKGAYQIVVDLTLQEVRQVQASYATADNASQTRNAQDPGAVSAMNTGKVQGQPFSMPSVQAEWA